MKDYALGFDIGGTKCARVTGGRDGQIYERFEIRTRDYATWEKALLALLPPQTAEKPLSAGVSCGGPLDSKNGLILSPPNLPGWDEVPIVQWLEKRLGVPAFLQNDANACALAEWRYGAGRRCRNMVFLTFGTGFGAGLILNGALYEGTNDFAGEIGHVRAAEDGPIGYGKRGSFEGFCSGGGISQLSGFSAKETAERAEAGDEGARRALRISAETLGKCAALLMDLINPERIVIGSIFARAEKWFREPMERVIAQEALPYTARVCRVVPAELGDTLGDKAALTVAWNGLKGRENHA